MKKNTKSKIIALVIAVLGILGISIGISATDTSGKIILSKTATKVKENFDETNPEYGRLANVTLTVGANSYPGKEMNKVDIILVLDSSGSMAYSAGNTTRMAALKNTAKNFVKDLIDDTGNVQIGIVEFDNSVQSTRTLTTNETRLTSTINSMSSGGGTNIQSGIAKADELLDNSRADAKKIVIILTDGIPTFYNHEYVDDLGRTQTKTCGDGEHDIAYGRNCPNNITPSDAAKTSLDSLKTNHPTADVYTITFGNEPAAATKLEKINPSSAKSVTPIRKNITALTDEDLEEQFGLLKDVTKNIVGTNSKVVDVIPKEFKLTAESKTALQALNVEGKPPVVTIVETNEGTTITWNLGNIEAGAGNEKTLSYDVVAKDEYHGSIYTNETKNYESATLTTTVDNDNPYYKSEENKTLTLKFESPVADIPAITNDDHYNDNPSYIGTAESTITGTTILTNDLNKNLNSDKENASQELTVIDQVVIDENTNTEKLSENTYKIKDGDKELGTLTINADGTFTFVSKENIEGDVSFNYHIKTTVVRDGITSYLYSNSSTVTLKVTPREKINISGEKVWDDANNQDGIRPTSITVVLKANSESIEETTITGPTWTYEFKDLYKYAVNHEGNEEYTINYTVAEKTNVSGYTTTVNGTTITNTHIPETINITGTKIWNDNNNQDGIRPTTVTVNLFANGEKVATTTATKDNSWKYEFKNVPKYKAGQVITYTVAEEKVNNYETAINGTTITNTHTPELIEITGKKVWEDNNNQDGKRPSSITVNLLANGKVVKSVTVTEKEGWLYKFKDVPKYESGTEITYTVTEEKVNNYETAIDGTTITNTHTPETVDITGTKIWDDANNQDGKRPTSITVNLLANGSLVDSTTVTKDTNWKYEFKNVPKYKAGTEITYTVTENKVAEYETLINGTTITNVHTPETTKVSGTKTWEDNDDQDGIRPESITINLLVDNKVIKTTTATSKTNWTYKFTNLPKYEAGKVIAYTVEEVAVEGYKATINGFDITNTHTPEEVEVSGTKTWDDANNQDGKRPTSITVRLYANGKEIKNIEVTNATNWTYKFTNLPKKEAGKVIAYTVTEDKVDEYETEVEGFNITNKHIPEKISLSGTKTWNDNNNQDGKRPESITVNLLANGKEVSTTTVTEKTNWKYEFKNVPKYEAGKEIKYTVSEVTVDEYTTTINGMNITNTHTPETITVSGTKTWNDANNQDGIRPNEITVNLHSNGTKIKSVKVTAESEWTYSFENLPKFENGTEITYTVTEDAVANYKTSLGGYNITNTYVPETIKVSGTKIWDDANNQDGLRPESITVNLLADAEIIKTKTVTANDNWLYTFDNLPKYRDQGIEIVYTIAEVAVDGYNTTVNGYDITNTHKPGTVEVSGIKTWDDNNNQDGKRPESITVNLLANGEVFDTKEVTEANGWTYTFANLDEFKEGVRITYTVTEEKVEEYETTIEGFNITNTHTPELIEVSGTKTWDDADNQDGMRPESITVRLLANGKEVAEKVVTESTNWSYTFTNVPKYEAGQTITYTVTEDAVEGYEGTVDGMNITNKHTPITITINGQKVWVDEDNVEGLRPESIIVRLFANGTEVKSTEVTSENNWTYAFENLPQYSKGKEINYTAEEDTVEHYESSIDKDNKFIIVNTHDPKDITISGTKTWIDEENRYGRPESITVTLTGKIGDKVIIEETKEVTEEDNWTYEFTNLPEYREGILIVYTIDEADVKDYDKLVNGFDITNTYNPETISIIGTKTWEDNDNQDGLRPESIIINLLANGEVVETMEVTEENNWTYEFTNQVVYANGVEIEYTVEEITVDGYTTAVEGFNITNHHTPETVSYTVAKVWKDQNNNDRIRPEEITVRLLADGKEIDVQVIGEETEWTYSFNNLPKYRDGGVAIKYEIIEDEVKGYTTSIEQTVSETDINITNVIITNTHENEKNEITINKIWDDSNNEAGIRPESITVTITGKVNDEVVVEDIVEITKEDNWTYTAENHDKYLDGEEIVYEIEEQEVEGYITFYDGYDITNAFKATGEITPPNTGVSMDDLTVNNIISVNAIEIPTSTKPYDMLALIFIAISSIGLTSRYIRKVVTR